MAPPRTARPVADNVDPAPHNPDAPQPVADAPTPEDAPGAASAEASQANADRQDELVKPAEDEVRAGSAPFVSGETIRVRTTGNFNLMDPYTGKTIGANDDENRDPIPLTDFIEQKLASGELEKLD